MQFWGKNLYEPSINFDRSLRYNYCDPFNINSFLHINHIDSFDYTQNANESFRKILDNLLGFVVHELLWIDFVLYYCDLWLGPFIIECRNVLVEYDVDFGVSSLHLAGGYLRWNICVSQVRDPPDLIRNWYHLISAQFDGLIRKRKNVFGFAPLYVSSYQ